MAQSRKPTAIVPVSSCDLSKIVASRWSTFRCREGRNDLRKGVRILPYARTVIIAYRADDHRIDILRVFHGGRDYENLLREGNQK
jgi:plasmid stabilization system protein ParE